MPRETVLAALHARFSVLPAGVLCGDDSDERRCLGNRV